MLDAVLDSSKSPNETTLSSSETIGVKIKKLRKSLWMTLPELAELCDVSRATIINWEKNKRIPDMLMAKKLAVALETTVAYLVGDTDDDKRWELEERIKSSNKVRAEAEVEKKSNKEENRLYEYESELVKIYRRLDIKSRVELMHRAMILENKMQEKNAN